ncbi:MAG TPA: hypothetical protein VK874_15765, partial [Gaiellaceae bacterium]|nr:hypothetical protein [Gaiellaceae bacterium]
APGSLAPTPLAVFNDYSTPARAHASARAVVHYVVLGVDAPPLNDDDGDGVPDYVEHVGAAADAAIAYFEQRGFRPIRPDRGGPDPRPDLYVSRFSPGMLGAAFPPSEAEGGAFAAVSNGLDPSGGVSFASVYGTVAHEVFHLVQFAYFGTGDAPAIPTWILEGSAAALESRVFPELVDGVSRIQLRRWLAAPHRSLTTQSYGAQLLWRRLDARHPRLLPALLARLAARPVAGEGAAALVETYRRATGHALGGAFHELAVDVTVDHADELTALGTVRRGTRASAAVPPLAIHLRRLSLPRSGPFELSVELARPSVALAASVVLQLESVYALEPPRVVRIAPRVSRGGRTLTLTIPPRVRRSGRLLAPFLVLSNGGAEAVGAYRVSAR